MEQFMGSRDVFLEADEGILLSMIRDEMVSKSWPWATHPEQK
jgi:hypothetical protein